MPPKFAKTNKLTAFLKVDRQTHGGNSVKS